MKRVLAVAALLAAPLLAGCGGSDEPRPQETISAPQLLANARAALAGTTAVHVVGTFPVRGVATEVDFQLQNGDVAGTQGAQGVRLDLTAVGGNVYVKAPLGFWRTRAPEFIALRLPDRWVQLPDSASLGLNAFTPRALSDGLATPDTDLQPQVTNGDVDGRPALVLTKRNGSQLFVAASGEPLPLRITDTGPPSTTLTLTDHGVPRPITVPPDPVRIPGLS